MITQLNSNTKLEHVPLVREFLSDHQAMSRLLLQTLVRLEEGDVEAARKFADELDRVGGPHIAYEETELYPRVSGEKIVSETTRKLYDEHLEAVRALKKLLDDPAPDEATREEIISGLRTGVHHAEHCGSLVSLLAALPETEQNDSLAELLALREHGRRWTDRIR